MHQGCYTNDVKTNPSKPILPNALFVKVIVVFIVITVSNAV